jgi:2-methylcitrate dehydratase PrpD
LAAKTKYVLDDSLGKTPGSHNPSRVVIKMKDGTTYEETVYAGKGSQLNPMTSQEICEKFRDFASESMPEAKIETLIKAVNGLELMGDSSRLAQMLTAS